MANHVAALRAPMRHVFHLLHKERQHREAGRAHAAEKPSCTPHKTPVRQRRARNAQLAAVLAAQNHRQGRLRGRASHVHRGIRREVGPELRRPAFVLRRGVLEGRPHLNLQRVLLRAGSAQWESQQ